MSKMVKQLLRKELENEFRELDGGVVIGFHGLSGKQQHALRAHLRGAGVRLTVVPNRIGRRALQELDVEVGEGELLCQDSAIAHGESAVAAAKAIRAWVDRGETLKVRGAFLEGKCYPAEQVASLASLPSREELLATLAGLFQSGAAGIASCFQAASQQMVSVLAAFADSLEKADTGSASA